MKNRCSSGKATASRRVRRDFSFEAPGASDVTLVGDFTHWQEVPLRPARNGVWRVALRLGPGTYHYRFRVDGKWQDDPRCPLRCPNPYGVSNDVLIVPTMD